MFTAKHAPSSPLRSSSRKRHVSRFTAAAALAASSLVAAACSHQVTTVQPETCDGVTCGGHGTCALDQGIAVCTCDTGYGGSLCATCAAGSHAGDGGPCAADVACLDTSCDGHGTCDASSGALACTCDAGFSGAHCETNVDDCDATSCLNGGTCIDGVSTFSCVCPAGFAGVHCEIDYAAPPPVTGATVSPMHDGRCVIGWTNPADGGFVGVTIRRSTTGFVGASTDGTQVYTGAGTSFADTAVTPGTTYYYGIFAEDAQPNASTVAEAVCTPQIVPPVTGLTAVSTNTAACALTWTNPAGSVFASLDLRRSATGAIATVTDGTSVYTGTSSAYTDVSVTDGTTYHYGIFAKDAAGTASVVATATCLPHAAPSVLSSKPLDGQVGLAKTTSLAATFSIVMDTSTVTAQATTGACTGSFQLSSDAFTTCVGGTLSVNGNPTLTFTPASALTVGTTYLLRVTTAAKAASGVPFASAYTMTHGFVTSPTGVTAKVLFPSRNTYQVTTGLAQADNDCNTDAGRSPGSGTFKALLGASTRFPCSVASCGAGSTSSNWVLAASTAYVRPDGRLIFSTDTHAIVTAFPMTNAISPDGDNVWTGMNTDWTYTTGNVCNDWTSNVNSLSGRLGWLPTTGVDFLNGGQDGCGSAYRLICAEQ